VTRGLGWLAAFVLLAAAATGCQERLTAPAECPELCPGGQSRMFDTVIPPLANLDTSYVGYVARASAGALLVSNGLPASEDRAVIRFAARADSIVDANDTLRAYTVDSALLALNLVARDTLVNGLKLYLYRIDPGVDADDTFESVNQQLVPTAIIDSIEVPDSVNSGLVQTVLRGAEVEKVALPTGGGGVLAMGVAMAADQPSGVRLGSSVVGTGATFISYVTLDVADTGSRHQSVTRLPAFNAFVTQSPPVPDDAFLTVGGEPSARALLRFDLPEDIEDSATIVRATLELVPRSPILGLPSDPALLLAKALLADLGAKSPVTTDGGFISSDTLALGSADTVRLDVTSIVRLWQAASERPEAVFLSLLPEGASFTRPVFGSTRSGTVGAPRLRITYLKPFPFESP
jgi:hypothetical protein